MTVMHVVYAALAYGFLYGAYKDVIKPLIERYKEKKREEEDE